MGVAQYTDPAVSRLKFDREINEFRALANTYWQRGWFLVHAEFPRVRVVLGTPKTKPTAIVMGVAFDYANYDAAPPSVRLVNPFTDEPYRFSDLPTQLMRALPEQTVALPGAGEQTPQLKMRPQQPLMQAQTPDEIPFLCVPGVREYHEHPAHNGDAWELHRAAGAGRLVRLLEIISRYGLEPVNGFHVQFIPVVSLQFGVPPT